MSEAGPEPRARVRPHLAVLRAIAGMAAATWAASVVAARVPWPIEDALGARAAFAAAFAWVSAEALVGARLARDLAPRALALTALGCAATLAGIALVGAAPSAAVSALVGALLVGAGASSGAWVGARIQHAGHLGVVAVMSSLADAASVLHASGPTAQLALSAPGLSLMALGGPMLGTADLPPILGVGDVVMAALYAAAAHKHALPERRTWVALAAGLCASMIAVVLAEAPLPALPFLGASILAAHPSVRLPPPRERPVAAIAVIGLTLLVVWLFFRP